MSGDGLRNRSSIDAATEAVTSTVLPKGVDHKKYWRTLRETSLSEMKKGLSFRSVAGFKRLEFWILLVVSLWVMYESVFVRTFNPDGLIAGILLLLGGICWIFGTAENNFPLLYVALIFQVLVLIYDAIQLCRGKTEFVWVFAERVRWRYFGWSWRTWRLIVAVPWAFFGLYWWFWIVRRTFKQGWESMNAVL